MKIFLLLMGVIALFGSCSTPESSGAAQALGAGSSQSLLYLNCRAVSQDEVEFEFSQPVTVKQLSFEPELEIASITEGSTVKVKFDRAPEAGKMIVTEILAEDEKRNSINVIVSFRSRNGRMPALVINEVCTEYASVTAGKKAEFIELKMKSDGNLGAMRLFIRGDTEAANETIYEFSPVEVKKNDYVVLHLRTYDEASRDEYTNNLAESGGMNSSPEARDFWIPGSSKLIHKSNTFIYVLDQDDKVIDALILSEKPNNWWVKEYLAKAAELLYNSGSWKTADGGICSPMDAFTSAGTTNTRTICRDENVQNTNSAKDWYITDTSCATPGRSNNPKRYLK